MAFPSQVSFLPPDRQYQSTEEITKH